MREGIAARYRSIRIRVPDGTRNITAIVFGAWAAHEAWQHPERWGVTHVPTGLALSVDVTGVLDAREAIACAARLHNSGIHRVEDIQGQLYMVQALVAEAIQ